MENPGGKPWPDLFLHAAASRDELAAAGAITFDSMRELRQRLLANG